MAAYISGYNNTMDVAGFGFTTQSAMFYQSQHAALDVHEGVTCDGCNASPLRGIRWRCQSCPDHDICGNCKRAGAFADHAFQMVSVTSTNNMNAMASGTGEVVPEAGVHWTTCRHCGTSPIRGTLYACTVCANFDLCDPCNRKRFTDPVACEAHPHRFDFHVMPRPQNPPPNRDNAMNGMQGGNVNTYQPPQQYHAQQQGFGGGPFEAPPMPHYDQPRPQGSTIGRIVNWLNGT